METLKFKDPNLRLSSKADKENKPAKSSTIKKVEVSSADQGIALNAEQRTVVQKLLHFEDGHRAKLTQLRLEYENIARAFSTRFFAEKQRADVLQHQLLNAQDQLTQVHTSFAMLGAGQNERLQLLEQENAGLSLALRQTRLELQVVLQNVRLLDLLAVKLTLTISSPGLTIPPRLLTSSYRSVRLSATQLFRTGSSQQCLCRRDEARESSYE